MMPATGRWPTCSTRSTCCKAEVLFAVANLLNLEVDLLFFDASSTYRERDAAGDELLDDEADDELDDEAGLPGAPYGDGEPNPPEDGVRRYGPSTASWEFFWMTTWRPIPTTSHAVLWCLPVAKTSNPTSSALRAARPSS